MCVHAIETQYLSSPATSVSGAGSLSVSSFLTRRLFFVKGRLQLGCIPLLMFDTIAPSGLFFIPFAKISLETAADFRFSAAFLPPQGRHNLEIQSIAFQLSSLICPGTGTRDFFLPLPDRFVKRRSSSRSKLGDPPLWLGGTNEVAFSLPLHDSGLPRPASSRVMFFFPRALFFKKPFVSVDQNSSVAETLFPPPDWFLRLKNRPHSLLLFLSVIDLFLAEHSLYFASTLMIFCLF